MNEDQVLKLVGDALEKFKSGVITEAAYNKEIAEIKAMANTDELKKQIKDIQEQNAKTVETIKEQGEFLRKMSESLPSKGNKVNLRKKIAENKELILSASKEFKPFEISLKANHTHTSGDLTGEVSNFHESYIAELAQGYPYIMEILKNVVPVGDGSFGEADYWEQLAVTNNAQAVAENGQPTNDSAYTWTRRTVSDKEVVVTTKISQRSMANINWLMSQVESLAKKDFMLKLQDYLVNGPGVDSNAPNGLFTIAGEFDYANAKKVVNPTLMDVISRTKSAIVKGSKNKFTPNMALVNQDLIDNVILAKNDFGDYIYPSWAQGENVSFSGINILSNELNGDNKMIVGDMSAVKLYIWDDVTIKFAQEDQDFSKRQVTLMIHARLNLDCPVNDRLAIKKISNVTEAINGIKENVS